MALFVLDSDVVIELEKAGAVGNVQALPVLITDAVWDELLNNECSTEVLAATEALLEAMAGSPVELQPQSDEAKTVAALELAASPKFGLGERSVIAYSMHHPDTVAVLLDKLAIHRAVEELRVGQVMSLHRALHELEKHGLPPEVAEATSQSWCRSHTPHRPPQWWSGRAAL